MLDLGKYATHLQRETPRQSRLDTQVHWVSRKELVKQLRRYYEECDRIDATWAERGYAYPAPARPSFPETCRDLTCSAKTRKGTPCQRRDLWANGRCKLHGGMSTGPKTGKGKRRAAKNGFLPKRKRTPCEVDKTWFSQDVPNT